MIYYIPNIFYCPHFHGLSWLGFAWIVWTLKDSYSSSPWCWTQGLRIHKLSYGLECKESKYDLHTEHHQGKFIHRWSHLTAEQITRNTINNSRKLIRLSIVYYFLNTRFFLLVGSGSGSRLFFEVESATPWLFR